jgi:hypothetical protein
MLIGVLLCVLGFATYALGGQTGTAERSPTALIPAGFGAVLLLLGFFAAIRPGARKHLMHAAAAVGALGFIGSAPMFVVGIIRKGFVLSVAAQLAMAILTGVYVALSVRSFIAARRARQEAS